MGGRTLRTTNKQRKQQRKPKEKHPVGAWFSTEFSQGPYRVNIRIPEWNPNPVAKES